MTKAEDAVRLARELVASGDISPLMSYGWTQRDLLRELLEAYDELAERRG